MFKAKLIDSKKYYRYRQLILILQLLPTSALVIFPFTSLAKSLPIWVIVAIFIIVFVLDVYFIKYQKKMKSLAKNSTIEIDKQEIRIRNAGQQQEVMNIGGIDNIKVKEKYIIPADSLGHLHKEINGTATENFVEFDYEGQRKRFDFELDSYYMIEKLNEMVNFWKMQGKNIEAIV